MSDLRRRAASAAAALFMALLAAAAPAGAGDVTAFVSASRPEVNWRRGFGAALSTTWFGVLSLEGEIARAPGEVGDSGMTSFTASALVAPPIGALTPYGGLGVGVFRQTLLGSSDFGTLRTLVLGAKMRLGGIAVVKAEYRRLDLSGPPLIAMEHRLSLGAGFTF
jgi:Outer membrane protein beta-barrel domain